MKHVTLRSSSATNAGSGQASGKHSQLSLPFPFCHCCHPQFLTQFLCVCVCASTAIGALDRFRVARPLTCRLWSPYSMRRRYILFILFTRFFFIFCFCFSLRLWFHRLPRGLCKAFFTLFRFFFLCFLLRVKSLKWKSIFILLLHVREHCTRGGRKGIGF